MKNRTVPFGYIYRNGKIHIDTIEQQALMSIFEDYLSGISMLNIATRLTNDAVEFMSGNSHWNKARIKRIIEERRYLGSDEYPRMITPEMYDALQAVKDEKNTLREIDRTEGIYQLSVPVKCSCCDTAIKRR